MTQPFSDAEFNEAWHEECEARGIPYAERGILTDATLSAASTAFIKLGGTFKQWQEYGQRCRAQAAMRKGKELH